MFILPTDVQVFLSSTYKDLQRVRGEIADRLRQVLGTHLITMETFGSDEAPPNVESVRRVRECDAFIGIYAHRYGTVDPVTGKSITELELEEAERAYSSGTLTSILLYLIGESASWPEEKIERDSIATAGLERLKNLAHRHSVTRFEKEEDLPFYIIRDVLSKIRDRLDGASVAIRRQLIPTPKQLTRPMGMQFLTSEDRHYLVGREPTIEAVLRYLPEDPVVLLLGNSGVGKTSLIHAGLLPRAVDAGWRVVYTRPLGNPSTDVVVQLQASIFEGRPSYRGPLLPILAEIVAAIEERGVLIVIDQFEDILNSRELRETNQLIADLRALRQLNQPNVRVLVSYRADLEARLGPFWQDISGAAHGLSRVYLGGISVEEGWTGIRSSIRDLGFEFDLAVQEETELKKDLLTTSLKLGYEGAYPPYIQMFIDHVWAHKKSTDGPYRFKDYRAAGQMEGIVGSYLGRQLAYAQDSAGHLRSILASLVRSYAIKAQRSLQEVTAETGLSEGVCEQGLEQLIDLRLVRHIDEFYEVAHDYLAKRIVEELVDSEEREFKRFRELLSTKAAAFETTGAPLTAEELLMLYLFKERIVPPEVELRLLFASWMRENGPALFWVLAAPSQSLLEWLRIEENKEQTTRTQRAAGALLRRKVGSQPLSEEDYAAFRDYQLAAELAGLLLENISEVPDSVLTWGLRNQRSEVRAASLEAIVSRLSVANWALLPKLRESNSKWLQWGYQRLVLRLDVGLPPKVRGKASQRAFEEFSLLKQIAISVKPDDARRILAILRASRPKKGSYLLGYGISLLKAGGIKELIKKAQKTSARKAVTLLAAIDGNLSKLEYAELLQAYLEWNLKEANRGPWSRREKVEGLGEAILRTSSKQHLRDLRSVFRSIHLRPSAQTLALALVRHGDWQDFNLVLNRIGVCKEEIYFWHHLEIARQAVQTLEKPVGKKIPLSLLNLLERTDFWGYVSGDDQAQDRKELLPVHNRQNRPLYVRLAAHGIIALARKGDEETLLRLAVHPYRLIARAAAIRLIQLAGVEGLKHLSSSAKETMARGYAEQLAGALRDAEMYHFGLARF